MSGHRVIRQAGQSYVSSRFRVVQKTRPPRWRVGERGPEIVLLPAGARVSTYTQFFEALHLRTRPKDGTS